MAGDPTANPYELLGLDPWSTPEEITERMREMAEEAEPEERARLQAAWRELTLHPADRAKAAFFAHPKPSEVDLEDEEKLFARLRRRLARASARIEPAPLDLAVADLVILPGVRAAAHARAVEWPDVAPEDDPLLDL